MNPVEKTITAEIAGHARPASTGRSRSPLGLLFDLFSSIWLGVTLLSLLFVYSSLGSALPPIRQIRIFEMTEFEWFHYWPFDLLIALICINIIVATLRRIPFKLLNYGVWMIHSGIIILCLGSVWYFGTKIEGESLVGRRLVTLSLPGAQPVSFAAQPGKAISIANDELQYTVAVANIDPQWELLSGDDKGKRTYSVMLNIQRRDAAGEQFFMRQLIADYPQYTEDIVRTNNHSQPMQRAKKINPEGDPLLDKTLTASLDYQPEEHLYLIDSAAVYLRALNSSGTPKSDWIERPIDKLPRYHEYISDYDSVWLPHSELPPPIDSLNVDVPAQAENDPLADASLTVTDYLRYAIMDERRMPGGESLDPVVTLELAAPDGRKALYELVARDPAKQAAENGELLFVWADSDEALQALRSAPGPRLSIEIPATGYSEQADIQTTFQRQPDAQFIDIGDTGYSYRVDQLQDDLVIDPNRMVSVAMVQVRTPAGESFLRMVGTTTDTAMDFPSDQQLTQHEAPHPLNESIVMTYQPSERPAAVTVIAGPQRGQLHVLNAVNPARPVFQPIEIGGSIDLGGAALTVKRYASSTFIDARPAVVAQSQRNKDVGSQLSMIRVTVPTAGGNDSVWLPFHLFPFESEPTTAYRFRYQPTRIVLDDKATPEPDDDLIIELMYSRQRQPLPAAVVLDDFILSTHTGGFTGNASIRNWTSVVRFADHSQGHRAWSDPLAVSVNEPIESGGYWYFQSRWDAPDGNSMGRNFTVLGVGNRNGVNVMLAGCCIAVLGMIFVFYIKPALRRKQIMKVHEHVTQRAAHATQNGQPAGDEALPARTLETVQTADKERAS